MSNKRQKIATICIDYEVYNKATSDDNVEMEIERRIAEIDMESEKRIAKMKMESEKRIANIKMESEKRIAEMKSSKYI